MSKILIIKLGALGDIIMACPVIKQIQEHHGDADIYLLTCDTFKDFFSPWPRITLHSFARRNLGAMLRTLNWIRAQQFTRIYDLQSNDRSGILCAFSGAVERVGNHPRYPYTLHPDHTWRGDTHIQERWHKVLVSAGLEPGPLSPWLPIQEQDRSAVASWLTDHDLTDKPFAILHPGASPAHPEKRWPFFDELAHTIRAAGIEVVWSGSRDDLNLNRTLAKHGGIDASGAFTLLQLAALGGRARFAVTNDSAPMHALACAGIPVFGLFGPTDWRRTHALGQVEHVICANGVSADFQPVPLAKLAATDVVERLRFSKLLS